jgi:GTP-binding protein
VIKVLDARFVTTGTEPKHYPKEPTPEVAFVGRSNVGKSSMINTLANRRKLVRVSNTPGRTRTLNFFDIDLEWKAAKQTIRLADLPGYGFAKVSKSERQAWQKMIETYLKERKPLKVVVSIVDAEIGPTEDDVGMIDWLADTSPRVMVVATKIDRIPKAKRKPALKDISQKLDVPLEAVLPFSSTDKLGLDEVWEALCGVLLKD